MKFLFADRNYWWNPIIDGTTPWFLHHSWYRILLLMEPLRGSGIIANLQPIIDGHAPLLRSVVYFSFPKEINIDFIW